MNKDELIRILGGYVVRMKNELDVFMFNNTDCEDEECALQNDIVIEGTKYTFTLRLAVEEDNE